MTLGGFSLGLGVTTLINGEFRDLLHAIFLVLDGIVLIGCWIVFFRQQIKKSKKP
jgi:hypothetical protein